LNRKPSPEIAKVVIPLAIGLWLVGIFAFRPGVPGWAKVAIAFAMAAAILFVVGFLFIGQSGWRKLAQAYPAKPPLPASWTVCPTAIMSQVSVEDPEHVRRRVRLNFILRTGCDANALYISARPIVSALLPTIRIPWSAIASARFFAAPGWTPTSNPGTLVQLTYDPGYKGRFVEIEIGEPHYFLQLPADLLSQAIPRLPIAPN
jgi:hypothetical protein